LKIPSSSSTYTLSLHDALPIWLARVSNIPLADLVAATYTDVDGARLESLLQVYLGLPEDKRRLLEAIVTAFEAENQQHFNKSQEDRKSTRLNSSHRTISYAVFC